LALYTCDGTAFAAVYGEDASTAQASNPALDVGYVLQPRCATQLILAINDFATTPLNTPVIIGVSSNDLGFLCTVDPASITTAGLLQPAHGIVQINANGTVTYTPDTDYQGQDVFEYSICAVDIQEPVI